MGNHAKDSPLMKKAFLLARKGFSIFKYKRDQLTSEHPPSLSGRKASLAGIVAIIL